MTPKTINKISTLLRMDADDRRDRLLNMIEGGFKVGLDERIEEYKAAFDALNEFNEWVDEQDGE